VQDLTEDTQPLDLDAAFDRTMTRHRELVHQRNVKRRWITGGACALLLVAAAVIIPQLGSGTGQHVQVADGGGVSATTVALPAGTPVPRGYRLSEDGDVWVLTNMNEPSATSVPVAGEVGVAGAFQVERGVNVDSVEAGSTSHSVVLGFAGCSAAPTIQSVRYRQTQSELVVDATVERLDPSLPCTGPVTKIELPLRLAWVPGTPVTVADL
jgi:hypothetical protein